MNLAKTLKNGFSTGHGFIREPNSIRSAASLACINLQSSQNDCYGGQSLSNWDGALAKYVRRSFTKCFRKELINALRYSFPGRDEEVKLAKEMILSDENDLKNCFPSYLNIEINKKNILFGYLFDYFKENQGKEDSQKIMIAIEQAHENACELVEDETMQAMEGAIHNFNTLHSRAGAQVPFSSILFGMDTSPEGRLVTKMTLQAIYNGLGHGETAIFPIAIFQLRSGVNYNPGDPNYDLFQFACKVSAKRLFPNFLSLNASFNAPYYKKDNPDSYVCAMGCRTKTMANVNGPSESSGRGNFAFTTINLPYLALIANRDTDRFFELLDHYIGLSKRYLEYRFEIIAKKKVKNFPFVMGQGLYMGSENLESEDEIRPALLNSTLSIGFCGLAECLVALTGKHHGESDEAQELGLKIVSHMRDMTEMYKRQTHMNWSTFSTPAESTAGTFLRACRKKFGIISGVTDHEYISNSFHIPVYYSTSIKHKVDIEAPYHSYCDAG
nr:MAG TPA: anaerobic ribonucleoside triphosphate reductase [Caudoviricetes sp.]